MTWICQEMSFDAVGQGWKVGNHAVADPVPIGSRVQGIGSTVTTVGLHLIGKISQLRAILVLSLTRLGRGGRVSGRDRIHLATEIAGHLRSALIAVSADRVRRDSFFPFPKSGWIRCRDDFRATKLSRGERSRQV